MDIDDLYQERILALARSARLASPIDAPTTHSATASNPICGDRITLEIAVDSEGRISAMNAKIDGCALCQAGAGLILSTMTGAAVTTARLYEHTVANWLKDSSCEDQPIEPIPQGIDAFTPVKAFTARHECVILPFTALAQALTQKTVIRP